LGQGRQPRVRAGPHSVARPRRLAALLLVQQLIHYLLAVPETRPLESSEGIREVDQSAPRGQGENAECPRNVEPLAERDRRSLALIDQDEIRVQRQRECDGSSFSGSRWLEHRIVDRVNGVTSAQGGTRL